jgi:ubiquinone/menaquinone biosynthesis C-methylase UbiE
VSPVGDLPPEGKIVVAISIVILLFVLVFLVAKIDKKHREISAEPPEVNAITDSTLSALAKEHPSVKGFDSVASAPDIWFTSLRPVLHQASYYTVPTYYLDENLFVIDWNVAFGLVFSGMVGKIRGKHVNWFIAQLENHDEVFRHANEFTARALEGDLPLVDIETLKYRSKKYGVSSFVKVAAQLHDPSARLRAWSVALIPDQIDWPALKEDLLQKLTEDKLWSVYSASYDAVLSVFPPYAQLIQDVIAVVPSGKHSVVDLGAGTGNVAEALIKAGHRVTAVENNLGMLDRLRAKRLDPTLVSIVKASVENMDVLKDESFDAATLVNVLYAVDDPLACLRSVNRILKRDGVVAFSTTHSETRLDPLLNRIRQQLKLDGHLDKLSHDFQQVCDANKHLENTIALRHSRDDYRRWVTAAGFRITKYEPSTYEGAVMLVHAQKAPT